MSDLVGNLEDWCSHDGAVSCFEFVANFALTFMTCYCLECFLILQLKTIKYVKLFVLRFSG